MVRVIQRIGIGLALVMALLFATTAEASALPVKPTVDVGFNWWLMQGIARFDGDETRIMAEAGVVGAVAYATERIPNIWGKAAAAAAGVVIWEVANQALNNSECVTITFGLWDHRVMPAPC